MIITDQSGGYENSADNQRRYRGSGRTKGHRPKTTVQGPRSKVKSLKSKV